MAGARFPLDERPLRDAVLKAYHESRGRPGAARAILAAIRQFLSGPAGGPSAPDGSYFFETDPAASVAALVEELEGAVPGLARKAIEPVLCAALDAERRGERELAPNPALYAASLGGALAVKAALDETVACALVAAVILGLARLGTPAFEEALGPFPKPRGDAGPAGAGA
ncbi:MAG: hypothetical protein ACUVYA_13315 [Planctomycetota bacterium]